MSTPFDQGAAQIFVQKGTFIPGTARPWNPDGRVTKTAEVPGQDNRFSAVTFVEITQCPAPKRTRVQRLARGDTVAQIEKNPTGQILPDNQPRAVGVRTRY
jgi:hypothetical protein